MSVNVEKKKKYDKKLIIQTQFRVCFFFLATTKYVFLEQLIIDYQFIIIENQLEIFYKKRWQENAFSEGKF